MTDPETIFKEWEKEQESPSKKFLRSIPFGTLLIFGVILLILIILLFKQENIKTMLMIVGGSVALIYVLSQRSAQKQMLSEEQAKSILKKNLAYKQLYSEELPPGKIIIGLNTTLRRVEAKPTFYEIGFKLITPSRNIKHYSAKVNAFTGIVEGFRFRPSEFWGDEGYDYSYIRSSEDRWKDRYGKKR